MTERLQHKNTLMRSLEKECRTIVAEIKVHICSRTFTWADEAPTRLPTWEELARGLMNAPARPCFPRSSSAKRGGASCAIRSLHAGQSCSMHWTAFYDSNQGVVRKGARGLRITGATPSPTSDLHTDVRSDHRALPADCLALR
jgi:hypothetical protein